MDRSSSTINKQRTILIVLVILILIVAYTLFQLYLLVNRRDKTKVVFNTIPSSSKIVSGGKSLKNGTNYLKPGRYDLKVEKEGFQTISETLEIESEEVTEEFALTPSSQEAHKWARDNQELYLEYEGRVGLETQQEGSDYREKNPIIKSLPYRSLMFNIDYRTEGEDVVIIISSSNAAGRSFALQQIRDWGISPSDYVYEFENFTNIFQEVN